MARQPYNRIPKRQRQNDHAYRTLTISLGISLLLLAAGLKWAPDLDASQLARRLLLPMARLIGFIALGLVVGQAIEAAGWTRRMAALTGPLFRLSRLGPQCGAAFSAAFFSGAAANGMLLEFYETERITRRQLFLANLMNQVPVYFLHLPTTLFIVLPMTGRAGVIYFGLTATALVVRTLAVALYGRSTLPPLAEVVPLPGKGQHTCGPAKTIWAAVRQRLPGRIQRIVVYVVPIYIAVFLAHSIGYFDAARHWMARFIVTSVLPVEAMSMVILGFAAEFTSGFAAAGAMLTAGVLTVKQTALALIIGNVVAFPIRALRHQLPHYMGIFSPRLGVELLLMGQGVRVASLLLVGALYYWWG
ncbi:MAG: nucleoside recognition protein [Desulfosarcinaceae bacterium]|nr:nucleoside recognition protein [Desulfosarcinaceae bacterium]